MINDPPHYKSDSGLEAIDVLEAFFPDNPHLWTAVKYLLRCGKKNDPAEEIGKSIWYLERYLEKIAAEGEREAAPLKPRVGSLVQFTGPADLKSYSPGSDDEMRIAPEPGRHYEVASIIGLGNPYGLDTSGEHLWYAPEHWIEVVRY